MNSNGKSKRVVTTTLSKINMESEDRRMQDELSFLALVTIFLLWVTLCVCLFASVFQLVGGIKTEDLPTNLNFSNLNIEGIIKSINWELLNNFLINTLEHLLNIMEYTNSHTFELSQFLILIAYVVIIALAALLLEGLKRIKILNTNLKIRFCVLSLLSLVFLYCIKYSNLSILLVTSTILVYLIAPFGNGRYLHILQILCCIENTQVKHVSKQNSRVKNVLKNVLRIVLVLLMIVLASIQLHWMLKLPLL